MTKQRIVISGLGLALIAACTPAPEPICDRDVKIDKYGNVELAECQTPGGPGTVARGPFLFGLLSAPNPDSDFNSDDDDRNVRGTAPLVLTGGGTLPDDSGIDNPAPPAAGGDDDDSSSGGGGTPTTGGGGGTPTTGGGGGTPTTGGGGGTPTSGGGSDDTDGTPTNGGGGGTDDDGRPSTPEERAERTRLHHALREAKIERRTVNTEEKAVRAELAETPKSDSDYERLREENRTLRTERERLQDVQDERQEEFDDFMKDWPN